MRSSRNKGVLDSTAKAQGNGRTLWKFLDAFRHSAAVLKRLHQGFALKFAQRMTDAKREKALTRSSVCKHSMVLALLLKHRRFLADGSSMKEPEIALICSYDLS